MKNPCVAAGCRYTNGGECATYDQGEAVLYGGRECDDFVSMDQGDIKKFRKVTKVNERARDIGFAVVWRNFGWSLVTVDDMAALKKGHPFNEVALLAQGESLEQLDYFIRGIDFARQEDCDEGNVK